MSTDTGRTAGDSGSEQITNAAGERMSATRIEDKLRAATPLIGHAVCVGDRRPYNVALIVLDPRARAAYATRHGLADTSPATLSADEAVQNEVALGIDLANEELSPPEQIRRFAILAVDWRPGSDELTPTRKLKRRPIAAKYADQIEWMYAGAGLDPA